MEFFANFNAWLEALLATYILENAQDVATTLEPAVVTLGTLYVMLWGYRHLTGQIEEPLLDGLKRIFVVGAILAVALHLWLYDAVIVETFFRAPAALAQAIIDDDGTYDPVDAVDQIWLLGSDAASLLLQKGGLFAGAWTFTLAGAIVYIIIGLTVVYAIFLLSLARIALSLLLALGPLFISLLFFESTKRFFEGWAAQLAYYALIAILTVLAAALMTALVTTAANQAVAAGGAIEIAHAARVCLAAGLTFLVMRQVVVLAAGVAGGLGMSTFGVVSAALGWAMGRSLHSASQFNRGLFMDRETSRWDSLARKAGFHLGRGASAPLRAGMRGLTTRANVMRR